MMSDAETIRQQQSEIASMDRRIRALERQKAEDAAVITAILERLGATVRKPPKKTS